MDSSYAGLPSIVLKSSVDVTSGGLLCPNITVEFTCTATEVAFLNWFRNGIEIEDFNFADNHPQMLVVPPYLLFLDTVTIFPSGLQANITSRLVVNLSELMSGDNISCSQVNIGTSKLLSYALRGNCMNEVTND